jgi:integrase
MPPKPNPKRDPNRNLLLRDGIWYVRYKLSGRSFKQSLGTADVRKARTERDKILSAVEARRDGRVIEQPKSWQDAVDGYLVHQEARVRAGELSTGAAKRYSCSLVQITLALGWQPSDGLDGRAPQTVPLDDVTKATITEFIEARREEERATSTILNDLTAWSLVMGYAASKDWIDSNPVKLVERRMLVGNRRQNLRPPMDPEVATLIKEVAAWSPETARMMRWLRETGMRLAEALNVRAEDVHPCGTKVTLARGVKRNRDGHGGMTRTISLGRAADMLAELPKRGRLFAGLPSDSAVVSTRYGQWRRQRQARENRAAEAEGRPPVVLPEFRLHDLRHGFACASLVDDDTCIFRLSEHLGHTLVTTTEIYVEHLRKNGAMWRYSRDGSLFGSLPPAEGRVPRQAA